MELQFRCDPFPLPFRRFYTSPALTLFLIDGTLFFFQPKQFHDIRTLERSQQCPLITFNSFQLIVSNIYLFPALEYSTRICLFYTWGDDAGKLCVLKVSLGLGLPVLKYFLTLISVFPKMQWLLRKLNLNFETALSEFMHVQLFSLTACELCMALLYIACFLQRGNVSYIRSLQNVSTVFENIE